MSTRTIRVLHVEDDLAQRRFMAHHLAAMGEFDFDIRCVASESDAVNEFDAAHPDFVIVDYFLTEGNGLSCLQSLRARDEIVPIVAVSGVATPEIAAELLHAGADDYIGKQDLSRDVLARSVREALARADAMRKRLPGRRAAKES
jgi:DNA-binding response OmpR family regulator